MGYALGEEDHRDRDDIMSRVHSKQHDITADLGHLGRVALVGFLNLKVIPIFTLSLKDPTNDTPELKNGDLQCTSFRVE